MKIDILSLFPEFVQAFFDQSIIKRALDAGRMEMAVTNPRDYTMYRHRQVDDTIYGGGAGMLMMCQPIFDAVHHVLPEKGPRDRVIFLSPAGKTFNQEKPRNYTVIMTIWCSSAGTMKAWITGSRSIWQTN